MRRGGTHETAAGSLVHAAAAWADLRDTTNPEDDMRNPRAYIPMASFMAAMVGGHAANVMAADDVIKAEYRAAMKRAEAAAKAAYKGTPDARYEQRVTQADAQYAVAKARCDDMAGDSKDVCMQEAKADQARAKADAKAELEVEKAARS